MFSIIIPLYNKAPYIAKALRSVAEQTYKEFELIVIDDGSTDESIEKLRDTSYELREKNLDFYTKVKIIEQQNQGVSVTRNNGVKLAKYDYIAFLDADDWWEPTFLEEMKALVDEFPDAGIYSSSYFKVKNGNLIKANIGVEKDFLKGEINYLQVYAKTMYMPITSITVVLKKEVFEKTGGFNSMLKFGEDFDLWLRITWDFKFIFLNKELAFYNQDIEILNRAVGSKLYLPNEHAFFQDFTRYKKNSDFIFLFEVLAVYGLMPYYLAKKNKAEVGEILKCIHWKNHAFKYRLYYRILPRIIVMWWFSALKFGAKFKKRS